MTRQGSRWWIPLLALFALSAGLAASITSSPESTLQRAWLAPASLDGRVRINVTPPGCVEVRVFKSSTGLYGFTLIAPSNTCITIEEYVINNNSIPWATPGCRSEFQVNPVFQPYMAVEPGSRVEVKLSLIGNASRKECLVSLEVLAHSATGAQGGGQVTTNRGGAGRASRAGVYGWLRGTPLRTSQYHRLKALTGSRGLVTLVGLAWLAVVVKRVCLT